MESTSPTRTAVRIEETRGAKNGDWKPKGVALCLEVMKALALKEEQFVTDAHGTRIAVLLDLKTYLRLRDAEEELDDIRAYDTARPKAQRAVAAGQFSSLQEYRARRQRKGA